MHLWRLGITFGLLAALTAGAAVVYKWTDAAGVVHYSDQPVPGAETIVTSGKAANGVAAGRGSAQPNYPPAQSRLTYKEFSIIAPGKEQVFFGDEVVPVRLQLSPGLLPKEQIVWKLNGSVLTDQAPDATAFALSGLDRGAYEITATITDLDSGETKTTDGVPFYVREPSALAPLNPLHRK